MVLARETTELAREQQRVAGDWQSEAELAREADRRTRARLKHIRKHEV
jgi:hypothetical protein